MKKLTHRLLLLAFISFMTATAIQSQNNALNFDGTDDYVDCGNRLPLSYTKEAWIFITDLSKTNNIISGEAGSPHAFWAPSATLLAGHQTSSGGSYSQVQDPDALAINTWYHVAVTYDEPTHTMTLYKNGVLVGTPNTNVFPVNDNARVYIGSYNPGGNVFGGNIDEVRIWSVARTASEIANNMNVSFSTPQTNLIANFRCNQGIVGQDNTSITTLIDDSARRSNGDLVNFARTGSISNFVGGSPVVPSNPLLVDVTTHPISCNGGTTTVDVTATGGTPPYLGIGTFKVGAGAFSFTATDAVGQSATIKGSITEPPALVFTPPSVSNVSCNKNNDGQIVVTATGGTGSITFNISPNDGKQKSVGTFKKLAADIYTITATDTKGCQATKRITVTKPDAIDPDKCYSIINKKTGKVLDVFAGSRLNAARIIQNASNGSNNQKWRFIFVGRGGNVKIVAQHCGKAVSNSGATHNSPVYQSRYTSRGYEDWKLECLGNCFYKIINGRSDKVLDVQNASMLNSAQIVIKNWDGSNSQQWQIVEVACPNKKRDHDDDDNLLVNQVANINGHAEAQRNVIGFTTNQGFRMDYLTVEKMNLRTGNFEPMAIINNTLNTDELQYQSFYDNAPEKGDNFYRIKQTDLNGDITYSSVQMIKYEKGDNIHIYPNPAIDEVWIDLKPFEGREVTLVLSDLGGKTIQQEIVQTASSTSFRLDLANIPTGLYLIKIHAQGKRVLMKKVQVTK